MLICVATTFFQDRAIEDVSNPHYRIGIEPPDCDCAKPTGRYAIDQVFRWDSGAQATRPLDFGEVSQLCYVCYVMLHGWTLMAVGKSGRIVLEIEPELKQRLYAALALESKTLKEWFILTASEHIREQQQPNMFQPVKLERQ